METRARKRVRVPDYEYDDDVAERATKRIKKVNKVKQEVKKEPQIKHEVKIKSEPVNNNEKKSDKISIKSEVKSEVKIELKKEKKEKVEVDSSFQDIDLVVAKILLDNLKLSVYDLKALSETCSSWHVKISTYLREMWTHTLQFSPQNFTAAQKIKMMADIGRAKKYVSDIQIFEFNDRYRLYHERTIPIPWCHYIVVVVLPKYEVSIIDLRSPDPIVPRPKKTDEHRWGNILVATNTHRKQLVICKRVIRTVTKNKKITNIYTHPLYIYNVSNDGEVDLVKQIDTKKEDAIPFAAYMQDDGSIWVAWKTEVGIYNVETSIAKTYDYPGNLGPMPDSNIIGFIEHNDTLKFVLQAFIGFDSETEEVDRVLTLLYDTKTRQHEEVPIAYIEEGDYQVRYIHDSLQLLDDQGNFTDACSLEPIIHQAERDSETRDSLITVSPDGSRILKYNVDERSVQISLKVKSDTRSGNQQDYHSIIKSTISFFNEEPKDEREVKEVVEKIKKKRKKKKSASRDGKKKKPPPKKPVEEESPFEELKHFDVGLLWLSNDIIVATYGNRISILDFRCAAPEEGFKSFEVPFIHFRLAYLARLTDTSFVIVSTKPSLVAIKITV